MLITFPENYRLYEHVKKTEKDGKTEVKSKTHAAGGNERQDAYLYGHPEGRRKRYRSPADFFPHLLWLCTDESGDHDNCGCKICSSDDLDDPVPVTKTKTKSDPDVKMENFKVAVKLGSEQGTPKIKQESAPATAMQRQPSSSQPLIPTPLPQPKSADQHYDQQYNTFMYRPGELVWFSRGNAWGLAVVLRRWLNQQNQYFYSVQPLSDPLSHRAPQTKSRNDEPRPWLAWSVPTFTNEGLNTMPEPPRYETADWQGLKQGRYGRIDLEVDASIMAAKMIDSSYTPFNSIQSGETEPGVKQTYYNGAFIGAEKVWLGDPIRLATGSGTDMLIVHAIVERSPSQTAKDQRLKPSIHLVGDVYQLQMVPHNNPNLPIPGPPSDSAQLPHRVLKDLNYRNSISIRVKQVASYWKLAATNSRVEVETVKGRWYEASILLPFLQPAAYEDAARKGEIQESTLWMNSRGDCINSNRAPNLPRLPRENNRKGTRLEAFGAAVPGGTEIRDGTDPPLPDNMDPALETMASQGSMEIDPKFETAAENNDGDEIRVLRPGEQQEPEPGGLDEFMNIDEDEDFSQMPGFGQAYDSQGNTQSDFF